MKNISVLLIGLLLIGCKARQAAVSESSAAGKKAVAADTLIARHYQSAAVYKTLNIRAKAHYQDEQNEQNVSAEIKIEKDRKILVSVRVLGITMAKALITPDRVQYYAKLDGTYFDGDFAKLSKWLGTPLDFGKVQNLLTGIALDDLTKGRYDFSVDGKRYKLSAEENGILKTFLFEAGKALLKSESLAQAKPGRTLRIDYPGYSDYPSGALPSEINIEAVQEKGKTNIDIEYGQATFNEDLSFPYSVPDGYERINID
jgi:hypothetical protein